MITRRPRILFLSHSASRNGASLLLLHSLQWLKRNSDLEIDVILDSSGPLIDDFRAVASVRVIPSLPFPLRALPSSWSRKLEPALRRLLLRTCLLRDSHDLVYANTAAAWPYLRALGQRHGAVLWHIHELPYALDVTFADVRSKRLLPDAARFVAASEAVARTLIDDFGVAPDRVDVIYGFVPSLDLSMAERQSRRARVRSGLGWPQDAFVIGACGSLGWRKGADLFLQIAHQCGRRTGGANLRFLWIGGGVASETAVLQFEYDRAKLGLNAVCARIPTTSEVHDYYCAMDAFALTSREEPFGLVLLEAALHELPIVCFDGVGGAPEFVSEGTGLVVPYLDLGAFCDAIEALRGSSELRSRLGAAGCRKARDEHSAESQGPKLLRSIRGCLSAT